MQIQKLDLHITPTNAVFGRDYRIKENENKNRTMAAINEQTGYIKEEIEKQHGRIDHLVIEGSGDSNPEVIDSRYSSLLSSSFPVLNTRLEFIEKDLKERCVNVSWFGVKGDGTDETKHLQKAAEFAKTNKLGIFIPKNLLIAVYDTVDFSDILDISLEGTIKSFVDHKPAIIIGGHSSKTEAIQAYIARVIKGNTLNSDDIGVKIIGVKNAKITIMHDFYTQLYANAKIEGITSISYSDFSFGKVDVLDLYGEDQDSWITDCNFYGGRYKEIKIGNSSELGYVHNNNIFYEPCVENGVIRIYSGNRNIFNDVRTEGITKFYFHKKTRGNVIYDNYVPNPQFAKGFGVVEKNEGFENFVMSRIEQSYYRIPIFTLDEDTFFRHGQCEQKIPDYESLIKQKNGYQMLSWREFFNQTFETQYVRRIGYITDGSYFRPEVAAYDKSGNLLNESDSIYASGSIWDSEDKKQKFLNNIGSTEFAVTSANASTFRLILKPGTVLDSDRFKRITIYIEVRREHIHYATTIKNKLRNLQFLKRDRPPTLGTWEVGDKIEKFPPVAGKEEGWKCIVDGTPGVWKSYGQISI
ncbi:hypothetical protein [Bacillus cereus group sp. IBL03679]|uniref:hypothetical protein n=1 Tax=Bacillus cereus group sp. IBL03679 TaxID=3240095 RepID=UPI003D2F8A9C